MWPWSNILAFNITTQPAMIVNGFNFLWKKSVFISSHPNKINSHTIRSTSCGCQALFHKSTKYFSLNYLSSPFPPVQVSHTVIMTIITLFIYKTIYQYNIIQSFPSIHIYSIRPVFTHFCYFPIHKILLYSLLSSFFTFVFSFSGYVWAYI